MSDGTEYIGEFCNGMQHGDGMLITKTGTQIIGKWVEGQFETMTYKGTMQNVEPTQEEIDKKDALDAALALSDRDSSGSQENNAEEAKLIKRAIKDLENDLSEEEKEEQIDPDN